MAILIQTRRSDLFPVGSRVEIHPRAAQHDDGPPAAHRPLAVAKVDDGGVLTVRSRRFALETPYVAYACVGDEHRYLRLAAVRERDD
jgi:hypothetical protein